MCAFRGKVAGLTSVKSEALQSGDKKTGVDVVGRGAAFPGLIARSLLLWALRFRERS